MQQVNLLMARSATVEECFNPTRAQEFCVTTVWMLFFHTLLHRIVIGPLHYSPSIFCSVRSFSWSFPGWMYTFGQCVDFHP